MAALAGCEVGVPVSVDSCGPTLRPLWSMIAEGAGDSLRRASHIVKRRAWVADAEGLLGALPVAQQRAAQRRGALQEGRVVMASIGRDQPRRRL
jgi:hypothetical protein